VGRYREIRTGAELEKLFPHIVEQVVPPYGFGQRLNLLERWLSSRLDKHQYARWGKHRNGQDVAVWGFLEPSNARAFNEYLSKVRATS
jgi:hypothetical protein